MIIRTIIQETSYERLVGRQPIQSLETKVGLLYTRKLHFSNYRLSTKKNILEYIFMFSFTVLSLE